MSADPSPGTILKASSPLAQFLAAGVLGLTGVLTALGVTGGAISRIMRNEATFLPCFLVIVLAVGLGVIAPVVSRQVPDRVLVPGVIVLLLALGWMAGLAVKTANSQERPNVSASLV